MENTFDILPGVVALKQRAVHLGIADVFHSGKSCGLFIVIFLFVYAKEYFPKQKTNDSPVLIDIQQDFISLR